MAGTQDQSIDDLIVRLMAVTRGLEDNGQYNAAKVFRAAALGEAYRAALEHPRPGPDLEQAMRELVEQYRSQTTNTNLIDTMEQALRAVESGRWPTLAEIGPTFVCRDCGEVVLGGLPSICPTCSARSLTFQEVRPIYYLDPMEPEMVLTALEDNLAEIERLVTDVGEEEASRGAWPMREILRHIVGANQLLGGRAVQMLEQDAPRFDSVPPTEVVTEERSQSVAEVFEDFRKARRAMIERFQMLPAEAWRRAGWHPEWGHLTVLQQLSYLVRHEQSHLAELEARRLGR